MRTAQPGDCVRVHYVKRYEDGSTASSRGRLPLEITVGVHHPRLPGLETALVGLAPGASVTVRVPPELASETVRPDRVRRLARARFPADHPLPVGQWVVARGRKGRRRAVRILDVRGETVVVDTNRRRAGQALSLEVELVEIHGAGSAPAPLRAIAFDVRLDSLTSLRQALPEWEITAADRVSNGSLSWGWTPEPADLLILGVEASLTEAFSLCRGLRSQPGNADTTILVLLGREQEGLVSSALEAGASGCLISPGEGRGLKVVVPRPRAGNPPWQREGLLGRPEVEDVWRDTGGEG